MVFTSIVVGRRLKQQLCPVNPDRFTLQFWKEINRYAFECKPGFHGGFGRNDQARLQHGHDLASGRIGSFLPGVAPFSAAVAGQCKYFHGAEPNRSAFNLFLDRERFQMDRLPSSPRASAPLGFAPLVPSKEASSE